MLARISGPVSFKIQTMMVREKTLRIRGGMCGIEGVPVPPLQCGRDYQSQAVLDCSSLFHPLCRVPALEGFRVGLLEPVQVGPGTVQTGFADCFEINPGG
jgi:hypothetical protein